MKTYLDKLLEDKEFKEKFDEEYKELIMGEKCQICGKYYDYVYEVSDKLWSKITSIKNGSGLRCIVCLTKEAREKNIELFWHGNLVSYHEMIL